MLETIELEDLQTVIGGQALQNVPYASPRRREEIIREAERRERRPRKQGPPSCGCGG